MNAMRGVHVAASGLVVLASLLGLARAGRRTGRLAAAVAGVAGLVALVAGGLRQAAFEPRYRRAAYLASRTLGEWLDRKTHLGIGACCFAIAASLAASDRDAPAWLTRLLCALAALLALCAVAVTLYVRARVPYAHPA